MADASGSAQAAALLAPLLLELRALAATVADLRDEQQHLARRLLSADDRRVMTRLAPLIHGLLQNQVWSAAVLYAAAIDAADAGELAALLADWNSDSGGLRSFGGLLERCAGCVFAGYRLTAAGARDRDGALYYVKRVSRAAKHAPPVAPGRQLGDDGSIETGSRN